MSIKKATYLFESWLAERIEIVPPDLDCKHTQMASAASCHNEGRMMIL